MTDPERISGRSAGLSSELLRAARDEEPGSAGMERTLTALGVSGALVSASAAAHAAASGAKWGSGALGTGGAVAAKTTSAVMLVKWIGVGVVGGMGLAGVAAVATSPAAPAASARAASPVKPVTRAADAPRAVEAAPAVAATAEMPSEMAPQPALPAPSRAPSTARESQTSDAAAAGAPLAAEVALIDEARGALAVGRFDAALSLISRYEREFPEARLLPEALFLRLEACERSGRTLEARRAAEQLLRGFPKSPHATRARKLLGE